MPTSLVRWGGLLHRNRLLFFNTGVATGLLFSGDACQQCYQISKKKKPDAPLWNALCEGWDWGRSHNMTLMGLVMGPFGHFWYRLLDTKVPGTAWRIVVKKIFWDQVVASPVFGGGFMLGVGLLEGKPWEDMRCWLVNVFPRVYLCDWAFWPAVQAVNFRYLPPHLRVVYVNVMTLMWDAILSYFMYETASQSDLCQEKPHES